MSLKKPTARDLINVLLAILITVTFIAFPFILLFLLKVIGYTLLAFIICILLFII